MARLAPLALALAAAVAAACGPASRHRAAPDAPAPWVAPACAGAAEEAAADPAAAHPIRASRLCSYAAFEGFSEQVAGERFTKAVIDLASDAILYFDVNVYPLHSDFVLREMERREATPEALAELMANYTEDKPRYLLVYLTHHVAQDVWAFAFWDGDRMRPEHVRKAWQRLRATLFVGDRLRFRPDSPHHEQVAAQLPDVPVVTNDEIYSQAVYQLFNPGRAVGRLRLVPALPDEELFRLTYDPEEILLIEETIPTLTVVAGVISQQFSTPLSHVSLRARAWGIPHAGVMNAATLARGLEGKTVFFEAREDGYTLREATPEEIAAAKAERDRPREVRLPSVDLEEARLRPLTDLRAARAGAYGAKAANLGEIVHGAAGRVQVPVGVGVPIRYYAQHLARNGVDARVKALLEDPRTPADPAWRQARLAELRDAIRAAPLDPAFLAQVEAALRGVGLDADSGLFVRSSTNAEDLPGFNGAGLYDTVPNVRGREALADAIRTVWASVWNQRAFEERTYFGIDHASVYGAVLIQRGVDATAAGVLVTASALDPRDRDTWTINAKRGLGIRVVEGKRVPEQILYDVRADRLRVLSRSDEDTRLVFDPQGGVREVPVERGAPVLTDARARKLVAAARVLTEVFPPDDPLDIEWLFEDDTLWIVQSRPYVVGGR